MPAAPKKFSLKPIEIQLLSITTQQQGTLLSNICSMIAIERLAITVTENTRFEISEDLKELTIIEDVTYAKDKDATK